MSMHPLPVLMRPAEIINLKEACFLTGRSDSTIRRLCRRYGLARQTGRSAPLEISRVGLEMALHGDMEALEKLRSGERTAPEVTRYMKFIGLQV